MKGNHKSKGAPVAIGKPGKPGSIGCNQRRKRTRMSGTQGKIKCSSCQATWQQRDWAKRSRAYKGASYDTITRQMNRKAANEQVKG